MRNIVRVLMLLLCCVLESPGAKERVWQTGEIDQVQNDVDSGSRSPRADVSRSRSQGPTGVPTVRQFIDIRAGNKIYTIQRTIAASSLRSVPGARPSPEIFEEGEIVKFVIEGKNLIILGRDGKERKYSIRKEGVF